MSVLKTLETRIIRWTRAISIIGLAGLLILAGITVGEILLRTVFKYAMLGLFDVSRLVIIIIVSSCMPFVCAAKKHITVRAVGSVTGPRYNAVLEAFGALLTMVFFGLMAWQLWDYANQLAASNEIAWLIDWPVAPWWRVGTIVIALCFPVQLILFLNSLIDAFSRKEPVLPAQT